MSKFEKQELKHIVEAALFAAGQPQTVDQVIKIFDDTMRPTSNEVKAALASLQEDYQQRTLQLVEVAHGFCFQIDKKYAPWMGKLWDEKPARYSRAFLETLVLIAYRQPITRGEIEEIRGVAVSSHIMRTLLEREWVRVVGHRDVPGKPGMYATTKTFLDYFNLKSLDQLPTLHEIQDFEQVEQRLAKQLTLEQQAESAQGEIPAVEVADDDELAATNNVVQLNREEQDDVSADLEDEQLEMEEVK